MQVSELLDGYVSEEKEHIVHAVLVHLIHSGPYRLEQLMHVLLLVLKCQSMQIEEH